MPLPCRAVSVLAICLVLGLASVARAQPATDEQAAAIKAQLEILRPLVEALRKSDVSDFLVSDVEVYAKAAEWLLRHNEVFKPGYADHALQGLERAIVRAAAVREGSAGWDSAPGRAIRGYRSDVDQSVQPYALSLPADFGKEPERRWPLHLVLHGRGANLNEVAFIQQHDGKTPADGQTWIQLDVFGRTNNAYRYAGEADVFEALQNVRQRFRIDDKRIVLHGFSMGGAGSWHLGLHYPSLWCSVGPGAGFVDFYKYQNVTEPLPAYQDQALKIYDAEAYIVNAFNVPICTYGGEQDAQLVASTSMVEAAKKEGIDIKLLVGPGVGHKFHPDSLREFMAFHLANQEKGRDPYPGNGRMKFSTWTLKYNNCQWITIEEFLKTGEPATVETERDPETGVLKIRTKNVAVLQVARDLASKVEIDGVTMPLSQAADGNLPGVYYDGGIGAWRVQAYDTSLAFSKNRDVRKRHNLQGPIDDAFMQPFVCVTPTGKPWSEEHAAWANWTLDRFAREFDKYLRGEIVRTTDDQVTADLIAEKNLILFGDPSSNQFLAQIVSRLPITWTRDELVVNGQKYDPRKAAVSLIFPNPMNPRRYVVLNSGHTFHAADFEKSNAWLFPRLGDIAVQSFEKLSDRDDYKETTLWAEIFDNSWKLPKPAAPEETK